MEVEKATATHLPHGPRKMRSDTDCGYRCAQLRGVDHDGCGVGGRGGCEGEVVAKTFTGWYTMMMLTNGEDRSLASKLYQQHHQAAPPARRAPLDGVEGTHNSMSSCAIRARFQTKTQRAF